VWIGYELVVAVVVFGKSVFWFRRQSRVTKAALESWVGLLVLAFFAAVGLSQWLEGSVFAPLVAFGLASGMIVSAAVNAAHEVGLRRQSVRSRHLCPVSAGDDLPCCDPGRRDLLGEAHGGARAAMEHAQQRHSRPKTAVGNVRCVTFAPDGTLAVANSNATVTIGQIPDSFC